MTPDRIARLYIEMMRVVWAGNPEAPENPSWEETPKDQQRTLIAAVETALKRPGMSPFELYEQIPDERRPEYEAWQHPLATLLVLVRELGDEEAPPPIIH